MCSTPAEYRKGFATRFTSAHEAKVPTTTQNGRTRPIRRWMRSVPKPIAAAGRTALRGTVKSTKGIGRIDQVSVRKAPESVGTTT